MNTDNILLAVNYDEIVNYIYEDDDVITDKIINYYKNYVFNNIPKEHFNIRKLDMIVKNYIDDIYFNSYIKNILNDDVDFYYDLDIILSKSFKNYLKKQNRKISMHRWI